MAPKFNKQATCALSHILLQGQQPKPRKARANPQAAPPPDSAEIIEAIGLDALTRSSHSRASSPSGSLLDTMTDSRAHALLNRLGLKHTPSLDDLRHLLRTTYDVSSGQSRVEHVLAVKIIALLMIRKKVPQQALVDVLGVSKAAVSGWKKRSGDLFDQFEQSSDADESFRSRGADHPELEHALSRFCFQFLRVNHTIPNAIIMEKALRLRDLMLGSLAADNPYRSKLQAFTASDAWVSRFCSRAGLVHRAVHGEAGAVKAKDAEDERKRLRELLKDVPRSHIFNYDESAAFYRSMPNRGYTHSAFVNGGKVSKDRVTVALCCNADGSIKTRPWIIGKSARPIAMRRFAQELAVPQGFGTIDWRYASQGSAWMDRHLFRHFLKDFVEQVRKKLKGDIYLLLDRASFHEVVVEQEKLKFDKVHFILFAPNLTSVLQPLDQGIMRAFKAYYRMHLTRRVIRKTLRFDRTEESSGAEPYTTACEEPSGGDLIRYEPTIRAAVSMISRAWRRVTKETIVNCWRHADILPPVNVDVIAIPDSPKGSQAAPAPAPAPHEDGNDDNDNNGNNGEDDDDDANDAVVSASVASSTSSKPRRRRRVRVVLASTIPSNADAELNIVADVIRELIARAASKCLRTTESLSAELGFSVDIVAQLRLREQEEASWMLAPSAENAPSAADVELAKAAVEEVKLDQIAQANRESIAMLAQQSTTPAVAEIPAVTRSATINSLTSAIQHLVAFPYASEADSYSVAPAVDILRSTLRRFTNRDIEAALHQSTISLSPPAAAPPAAAPPAADPPAAAPDREAASSAISSQAEPERVVQSSESSSTLNNVDCDVENDDEADIDNAGDDERSDDDGIENRAEPQQQQQHEPRAEASSSSGAVTSNQQQHASKKRKLSTAPESKPKLQRTVGHPGTSRFTTRTLAQPSKFVRRQTLRLLKTAHL